jgi:hypothetical protein
MLLADASPAVTALVVSLVRFELVAEITREAELVLHDFE